MGMEHFFRRGVAICLCLLASSAWASDDLWIMALGAQGDADGSSSVVGSLDWGVTDSSWLSFSFGAASSPSDRADVETRSFRIGLDHDFGPIGFSLGVEQWGEQDELESRDFDGSLYFRTDRFSLGALVEQRDIDITFTITTPLSDRTLRTASLKADGWGLRSSFQPNDRWRVFGVFRDYSYDRDLTLLPRLAQFDFLASSALTLANSFVDREFTMGAERKIRRTTLSATYGWDRSAVDGSVLESLTLGFLFPLADRVDIELNVGASDAEDLGSDTYGGVFLFFYGGS